ncbi:NAD-dependent epimerase/dehydratase family protein, partial [Leptospira borgpetersenii serovar Ballum]|uniref:NAD-dependent epimerase/dehydratase family protein n=1 Tax=Leptospira borgpetersenii TaxID=174 RepID=UPI0018811462
MAQKLALVAGATGFIGKYLLEELSTSPGYQKAYVLERRPVGVAGVEEIISDYDALVASLLPQGITDVFCSLGTTLSKAGSRENFKKVDYEYVLKLAKLVKALGAKSFFVVSALGANPGS